MPPDRFDLQRSMHAAAREGDLAALARAVAHGADPKSPWGGERGRSALSEAAGLGNAACVSFLLPLSDESRLDDDGRTALMRACMGGHAKCADLLANEASCAKRCPLGWNALFYACLPLPEGGAHVYDERCVYAVQPWTDIQARDAQRLTVVHLCHAMGLGKVARLIESFELSLIDRDAVEEGLGARSAPRSIKSRL